MNLNRRLPALPYVLLGALTAVTFGGPFAMLVMIRGGPSAEWPPDRAIEWVTIGLVFGLVIVLFSACVSMGAWYSVRGKVSAGTETTRAEISLSESRDTPNTIHRESTGR